MFLLFLQIDRQSVTHLGGKDAPRKRIQLQQKLLLGRENMKKKDELMCVHFPCTYSSPITMQQLRVALEQEIQTQSLPLERMDPDQKIQCCPEIKALSYSTPRSPSEKRIRKLATTLQEIKGVSAFVLRARNTTLSLLVYFSPQFLCHRCRYRYTIIMCRV